MGVCNMHVEVNSLLGILSFSDFRYFFFEGETPRVPEIQERFIQFGFSPDGLDRFFDAVLEEIDVGQ